MINLAVFSESTDIVSFRSYFQSKGGTFLRHPVAGRSQLGISRNTNLSFQVLVNTLEIFFDKTFCRKEICFLVLMTFRPVAIVLTFIMDRLKEAKIERRIFSNNFKYKDSHLYIL